MFNIFHFLLSSVKGQEVKLAYNIRVMIKINCPEYCGDVEIKHFHTNYKSNALDFIIKEQNVFNYSNKQNSYFILNDVVYKIGSVELEQLIETLAAN